jgi:hypothetical protein
MFALGDHTDVVQSFVDFSLAWLDDRNYTLIIDVDMAAWAEIMAGVMSEKSINPTFNPRFNRLSPNNSFWINIRSGSSTIATSAARLFITDDYLELKRSMRLWRDAPSPRELAICVPNQTPHISGRVGHEGGLWVHPEHRKRGLSAVLPHLNRALCLREWEIEWQTGVTMRGIGESGLAERVYGFPHVVPCFEGYLPLTGRLERLYMTYMSRHELVAGLETDTVARLLPDGHQQMAYAPLLAQKG